MTRRQEDPLRPLTTEERNLLTQIGRSHTEPAAHVARAKALLAVADGESYTDAAQKPPGVVRVTPFLSWFRVSIGRALPPSNRAMGAVRPPPTS